MRTNSLFCWLRAAVACAAASFSFAASADIPASAYVQRGLINHWDGIDNAGTGTYDPTTTTWKDLKGGLDMTLANKATWAADGNCLIVSGSCAAKADSATSAYRTIEVVYKMTAPGGRVLFASGCVTGGNRRWVLFDTDGTKLYADGGGATVAVTTTYDANLIRSFSALYTDGNTVETLVTNGVAVTSASSHNNGWNIGDGKAMVGCRNATGTSYGWTGRVYAIRLYSCELTPEELAENARLDRMRFFEVPAGKVGVQIVNDADDIPSVEPNPASGVQAYDSGVSQTFESGARMVGEVVYSEDRMLRKIFRGYSIDNGETVAATALMRTVDESFALEWVFDAERATAAQADRAGCQVSDGTVTASAVTNWDASATADVYTFTAIPGEGCVFAGWDCPALVREIDLSQPTVSVPAGRGHLLVARFAAATDADVYSYVQDGLIMHLDAIRNVGMHLPHDNAAKTWADLSPNHNDLTVTANGSWKDGALACNGSGYGAWRSGFALTGISTIEVVFRVTATGSGFVFTPGVGGNTVECVFNGTGSHAGILQFTTGGGQKTLNLGNDFVGKLVQASSVHQSPTDPKVARLYQNGATPGNIKTDGDGWGQGNCFCIGARSGSNGNYPLAVEVSAIRLYNRQLTPAEVARNYVVDQRRYGDAELPGRPLFSVWGEPSNYGTPTPDYGDRDPGDDSAIACSVADILQTYDLDGARAFRVDATTRALYTGYETGTYSTKASGVAESLVRSVAPDMSYVVWKWRRQYLLSAASANVGCTVRIGGGTAAASAAAWLDENSAVTLVAMPGEGYAFKNWTGVALDDEAAANPTLTLTMDAGKSVSALFKETAHVPTDVSGTGGDGEWNDGSLWNGGNVPGAGDRVTVTGGTLTLKGATEPLASLVLDGATLVMDEGAQNAVDNLKTRLVAGSVVLKNGAKITHVVNSMQVDEWKAAGEWRMNGRVHIVCTDLSIDATSSIDVNDRGFAKLANRNGSPGPGGSLGADNGAYGGGYGGCGYGEHITVGNTPDDWEHNVAYGDRAAPVWCGSGGGAPAANAGRAGGGAVRIEASGRVTVEGAIRADATVQASSTTYGAGSGGGIWIDCAAIAGGGLLSARGGRGVSSTGERGSGGGGRIAVHYDAAQQNALGTPPLRFDAGAPAVSATVRTTACVGTLQFTDDRFLTDTFGGDGATGILNGQVFCDSWTFWRPTKLALDNAWIRLGDPKMPPLALSGDVTVAGYEGRLDLGGDEAFSCGRFSNEPPYVRYGSTKMPTLSAANLTLSDGAMLAAYPAPTNGTDGARFELALAGAFTVGAGCLVHPHCHPTNGAVTRITAATASVAGKIDAQGAGFATCYRTSLGPGRGKANGRGAGYGGPASGHDYLNEAGMTYGDLRAPVCPGSSGGAGGNVGTRGYGGTAGGGLVWIEVAGGFRLDGSVIAKAQHGNFGSGTAYGSGGGIYLIAQSFAGTGSLDVSSDGLQVASQQAGGGRIALVYDTAAQASLASQPTFKLDAASYPANSGDVTVRIRAGDHDMGTIYLSDARFLTNVFTTATLPGGEIHCGDWSAYRPDSLYVNLSRVRLATDGVPLEIGGDVTVTNRASLGFGGGAHAYSNCMARLAMTDGPGARIRVRGNVVLHDGTGLTADTGYSSTSEGLGWDTSLFLLAGEQVAGERDASVGLVLQVDGDFVLGSAKTSCHFHPNAATGASPVLRARNVRQVEGAIFDAVGTGYSGDATGVKGAGPGGAGPGLAGGGHGGAGASYGGTAGAENGVKKRPCGAGGGGCGNGANNKNCLAGSGGGVIRIEAKRRMELAGAVTADGGQPTANYLGSGAGGSVYLACHEWAPQATLMISADGGAAFNSYGGGAGGRVMVARRVDHDPAKDDPAVNARGYSTRGYISVECRLGTAAATADGECGSVDWGAPPGGMMVIVR